ncbi:MAG: helix-turn-helix transcriptional regulator [Rhizobiaceae bacterium]|nr:helix-turn-helix transcriptional regulator [Rhizobiaceae bacterium]
MIDAGQIRAARGFLCWSQSDLADKAGLSVQTVKRMETKGTGSSTVDNVARIQSALESAGCTFLRDDGVQGPGVRARVP